ncbi:hypothetical protein D3C79_875260 [compost metagenome]
MIFDVHMAIAMNVWGKGDVIADDTIMRHVAINVGVELLAYFYIGGQVGEVAEYCAFAHLDRI